MGKFRMMNKIKWYLYNQLDQKYTCLDFSPLLIRHNDRETSFQNHFFGAEDT